jgi:hypothetical protein
MTAMYADLLVHIVLSITRSHREVSSRNHVFRTGQQKQSWQVERQSCFGKFVVLVDKDKSFSRLQ